MQGCTYFIQAISGGLIKIGYTSKDPALRLRDLQTGSPHELRVIATIPGNVERQLHVQFQEFRRHGEWFQPHADLVAYIRDHAGRLIQQPRIWDQPGVPGCESRIEVNGQFYDLMDHEEV
jgi:hypothetical protein